MTELKEKGGETKASNSELNFFKKKFQQQLKINKMNQEEKSGGK